MPRHASVEEKLDNKNLQLDISIARGDTKLDATISIPPGITVLVGPSGAGKSTLLLSIAGLFVPARGSIRVGSEIWFDSRSAVNLAAESRRVGVVFQSLALFPHLSVLENVRYGMPKKKSRADQSMSAQSLLDRFHIGDLAERKPNRLSGGEAQRVALARAIARDPLILLLDEPFSALDVPLRDALAAEVARCARDFSIPTLVVTHDLADAKRLDGNVARIASNRLAAEDDAEDDAEGVTETATLRVDS